MLSTREWFSNLSNPLSLWDFCRQSGCTQLEVEMWHLGMALEERVSLYQEVVKI